MFVFTPVVIFFTMQELGVLERDGNLFSANGIDPKELQN